MLYIFQEGVFSKKVAFFVEMFFLFLILASFISLNLKENPGRAVSVFLGIVTQSLFLRTI